MSSFRLALSLLATATMACGSSSPNTNPMMDSGSSHEAAPSSDTWNSYAKGFVSTYCVECHNTTIPSPSVDPNQNFNTYADVHGFIAEIRCGVAPEGMVESGCSGFPPPAQFPISDSKGTNPKPTDAERLRFEAWITAGAPEGT